jgi:membrane complex biogenesis BtpA family protein
LPCFIILEIQKQHFSKSFVSKRNFKPKNRKSKTMDRKEIAVLGIHKPVIAMIHVQALPGTPAYSGKSDKIIEAALQEAKVYQQAGVDVLMIENMHDWPYLKRKVGPEITAMMTAIGQAIKSEIQLPCGIQILAGANKEALAVAKAANLDFVRVEGFVFAHVGDEGLFESDAGELLRYRKMVDAEDILIFTDIKKKHSAHAITADVSLAQTAQAAAFFRSDGVIVTGTSTGISADPKELETVKKAVDLPVIVGSGITIGNVIDYIHVSDALIVGSFFKKDGIWSNPVDSNRVLTFMKEIKSLRE